MVMNIRSWVTEWVATAKYGCAVGQRSAQYIEMTSQQQCEQTGSPAQSGSKILVLLQQQPVLAAPLPWIVQA